MKRSIIIDLVHHLKHLVQYHSIALMLSGSSGGLNLRLKFNASIGSDDIFPVSMEVRQKLQKEHLAQGTENDFQKNSSSQQIDTLAYTCRRSYHMQLEKCYPSWTSLKIGTESSTPCH